jgi:DNA-binding transcriptional LysR family regulator
LAQLESELSTRLFDRSRTGYALTAAGEELLAHVARIENEVLTVGRKIGGLDQSLQGRVHVATVDDLAFTLLPPIVRSFREQHPHVAVDVTIYNDIADLARRQADVAIRLGSKPREPDVVARHVSRIGLTVYGSRSYLRKRSRPKSLADLAEHVLVAGDDLQSFGPMEHILRRYCPGATIAYRSNSMLARLAAVRDGVGLGVLPCFAADEEQALVRVLPVLSEIAADVWTVVHMDMRGSARVRAFVDFIHERLTAVRAKIEGDR